MDEDKPRVSEMPRLYNVFDMPMVKSVRAITTLRSKTSLNDILNRISRARKVRTSNKDVVKFELRRGSYLLLFPTNYIEIHAPDEGGVREVLLAFRDELFKNGLLK
ncbi:MAG: hypothetical protein QMD95_03310 [Candidatus Hodarchaeaceae archaeon]|nr:hypothetical protein [Candidatus Hodarchaeaceae archaeon]